jgi:hypothetical protein
MSKFIERYIEEKHTLAELRSQFRAVHLEALRDRMESHLLGWGVIGDPLRSRSCYDTEQWAQEMLHHLDEPVVQSFALDQVPASLSLRLEKEAKAALEHDSVTWDDEVEGVVDQDAPACPDVHTLSDDQLCDYIDLAITASVARSARSGDREKLL